MTGSKKQTVPTSQEGLPSWAQPYVANALGRTERNYLGPQPEFVGGAEDMLSSILQGDFLNPSSNPYLTSTFNQAADVTQNRLTSEFAGVGRNTGAAFPARSLELQSLASQIFGGAYQQERGLINQALGLVPQLATFEDANYANIIAQLAGTGREGSSQQAHFSNPWAGALGGAATGAAIGSVVPVIGTGIGAGIGGLFGALGS